MINQVLSLAGAPGDATGQPQDAPGVAGTGRVREVDVEGVAGVEGFAGPMTQSGPQSDRATSESADRGTGVAHKEEAGVAPCAEGAPDGEMADDALAHAPSPSAAEGSRAGSARPGSITARPVYFDAKPEGEPATESAPVPASRKEGRDHKVRGWLRRASCPAGAWMASVVHASTWAARCMRRRHSRSTGGPRSPWLARQPRSSRNGGPCRPRAPRTSEAMADVDRGSLSATQAEVSRCPTDLVGLPALSSGRTTSSFHQSFATRVRCAPASRAKGRGLKVGIGASEAQEGPDRSRCSIDEEANMQVATQVRRGATRCEFRQPGRGGGARRPRRLRADVFSVDTGPGRQCAVGSPRAFPRRQPGPRARRRAFQTGCRAAIRARLFLMNAGSALGAPLPCLIGRRGSSLPQSRD